MHLYISIQTTDWHARISSSFILILYHYMCWAINRLLTIHIATGSDANLQKPLR